MRVALMIEGQEGVGWEDWLALARTAEDSGYDPVDPEKHERDLALLESLRP